MCESVGDRDAGRGDRDVSSCDFACPGFYAQILYSFLSDDHARSRYRKVGLGLYVTAIPIFHTDSYLYAVPAEILALKEARGNVQSDCRYLLRKRV